MDAERDWEVVIDWIAVREARDPFRRFVAEHGLTDEELKRDVKVDVVRGEDGHEMMRVLRASPPG